MSSFAEKHHHPFDFGQVPSQWMVTMATAKRLYLNSLFGNIIMIKVIKFGEDWLSL